MSNYEVPRWDLIKTLVKHEQPLLKQIPNSAFFYDHNIQWIHNVCKGLDIYYTIANTVHWQTFGVSEPKYIIDFADKEFEKYTTSIIKQEPGMFINLHTDQYWKFKEAHNCSENVIRYCVFLQDWQPGHYFELDGEPIVHWKQGDYVVLNENIPHRGSNSGNVPKYTFQITGILKK